MDSSSFYPTPQNAMLYEVLQAARHPKCAPSHRGIYTPYNTFPGPTRLSISNCISIGSAVFCAAHCRVAIHYSLHLNTLNSQLKTQSLWLTRWNHWSNDSPSYQHFSVVCVCVCVCACACVFVCVCVLVCCLLHMNNALDREAPVLWHLLQDNLGKPAPERLNRSGFSWSSRWWGGALSISWNICKSFAPHCRQITMLAPHHSIFYRPDALPDAQPTVL